MLTLSPFSAPSAPRNLTVLEISAKLIRLTWQPPKDVNGMVSTSEADFEYKELGKWHKRNELFVKNPQLRSREVEVLPFTEYRLRVREATGLARKWGPFSETYSFITPEGGKALSVSILIWHFVQIRVIVDKVDGFDFLHFNCLTLSGGHSFLEHLNLK